MTGQASREKAAAKAANMVVKKIYSYSNATLVETSEKMEPSSRNSHQEDYVVVWSLRSSRTTSREPKSVDQAHRKGL